MTDQKQKLHLQQGVDLSKYSWFRVGGKARYFVPLDTGDDYDLLPGLIRQLNVDNIFVFGAGSNVLVSDTGFDGLVIKVNWSNWELDGGVWSISAGAKLPVVAREMAGKGYAGMEHLANIPGTVGGAIRGNAEAFRQSISDCLIEVEWLDYIDGPRTMAKVDCQFAYRESIFKKELRGRGIIKSARFHFPSGNSQDLALIIKRDEEDRRSKQPTEFSCGCFYKNIYLDQNVYDLIEKKFGSESLQDRRPGDMYATAKIIDMLGLKGERVGGASVSPIHANFIINEKSATAADIYHLHQKIVSRVENETGIKLEPEVEFCGDFSFEKHDSN